MHIEIDEKTKKQADAFGLLRIVSAVFILIHHFPRN
jgi:hypothetical protein